MGTANSASYELLMTSAAVNLQLCQTHRKRSFSPAYPSRHEFGAARVKEWKEGALFCSQTFSNTPLGGNKDWFRARLSPSRLQAVPAGLSAPRPLLPAWRMRPLTWRRGGRRRRPRNHGAGVLPGVVVPGEVPSGFSRPSLSWVNRISHNKERPDSPNVAWSFLKFKFKLQNSQLKARMKLMMFLQKSAFGFFVCVCSEMFPIKI